MTPRIPWNLHKYNFKGPEHVANMEPIGGSLGKKCFLGKKTTTLTLITKNIFTDVQMISSTSKNAVSSHLIDTCSNAAPFNSCLRNSLQCDMSEFGFKYLSGEITMTQHHERVLIPNPEIIPRPALNQKLQLLQAHCCTRIYACSST